jgi:lipopolysaccharide/colanic/teichoic acid biosynthesis glycosyltransferase
MKTLKKAAQNRDSGTPKTLSAPVLAVPMMLGSFVSELCQFWRQAYDSTSLRFQPAIKRAFDIAASGVALILLSPAFVIIGVAIALTSPGPIFYRASRVGRYGRIFKMYKFRTMVVNADKMGPGITTRDDRRVTRIGRLLRKTKLDELPQLINVWRGEMSIVGPRPEDPRYVEHYTPEQSIVLSVRPGITSPASVHYHDEETLIGGEDWETRYLREIMPSKLRLDIEYARHPSIGRDIGLIFQTLQAIGRGIRH